MELTDQLLNEWFPIPASSGFDFDEALPRALAILKPAFLQQHPIQTQVSLLYRVAHSLYLHSHREAAVIARLVGTAYDRLLAMPDFPLNFACLLYEQIDRLFWCSAQYLVDMREIDTYAVHSFVRYLTRKGLVAHRRRPVPLPGDSLRVGYLFHYAHLERGNAVARQMFSIIAEHAKLPTREIHVYTTRFQDPSFLDALRGRNVTVSEFPQQNHFSTLDALVNQVLSDEVDVLITDTSSSIATYVFAQRAAPLQMWIDPGIQFWSIPFVDWTYFGGREYQPEYGIAANRWGVLRGHQEKAQLSRSVQQEEIDAVRKIFPAGAFIIGVFTRLIKITPQYLDLLARILDRFPNTHVLIVGTGDPREVQRFMHSRYPAGRAAFMHASVDLNIWGRAIDVFADTFPFIGSEACREVAIHRKPIVSLKTYEWLPMLKSMRDDRLVADSLEQYVEIVGKLAMDKDFYADCAQASNAAVTPQCSEEDMISDLEAGIRSAASLLAGGEDRL